MNDNQLKAQAKRASPYIKIAGGLWVLGMMIIAVIAVTWVVLSPRRAC